MMLSNQFEVSFLFQQRVLIATITEVDVEKVFMEIDIDECMISGCLVAMVRCGIYGNYIRMEPEKSLCGKLFDDVLKIICI